MTDEFKRKWLQWVLDFIRRDISQLSRGEKFKLFAEISFFASDQLFSKPWSLFEKGIEFSQNQISEWELIAPQIQNALRELLEYVAPTGQRTIDPYPLPDLASSIGPPYLTFAVGGQALFHIDSIPKEATPSNWAVLNLARLMDGVGARAISRCNGCNAYFLNFSLREKIYCTSKCASRTSAQLRRERLRQNPKKYKAYLKKQKALTMKRYERLRKEKGKIVRHRRKED